MKRLLLVFTLTVAIGLIAVGCDSTGPAPESGSGTLELRMTGMSPSKSSTAAPDSGDVTLNIDTALVTITRTAIVSAGPPDSSGGGIEVLVEGDITVDLTELQSGVDTLMAKTDLKPGTFTQLRLITADKATVKLANGEEREVMVASGQETGLKLNFNPFTINSANDRVKITIQWDVEKSLTRGPQGRLIIKPAIQATVDTSGARP